MRYGFEDIPLEMELGEIVIRGVECGDVFYWPAGHTGWTDEGVTFLEYSPTAEILPVLDHLAKQLGSG